MPDLPRKRGQEFDSQMVDELEFSPRPEKGLRITCQRWLRPVLRIEPSRWFDFGVATRPCRMGPENGDAFVIRQWEDNALVGIIDGLGHGQFAQRAAQAARQYIEQHFDQTLDNLFRGVSRACSATRGVVMALVRFEGATQTFTLASVGNIEVRLMGNSAPFKPIVRRGIVGLASAPKPVPTRHSWPSGSFLIMHSDGVTARWHWDELFEMMREEAATIAQRLLLRYGRIEDDATVLVARNVKS